jgi:hypothetical protein
MLPYHNAFPNQVLNIRTFRKSTSVSIIKRPFRLCAADRSTIHMIEVRSIKRLNMTTRYFSVMEDELIFSPSTLSNESVEQLVMYEQLSRMDPTLFSPRHSPCIYPLELVYMLVHEYRGDVQRALEVLLNGRVGDLKSCRPLSRHHFPNCDRWTAEEIDAFAKAIKEPEKNFSLISKAVRTVLNLHPHTLPFRYGRNRSNNASNSITCQKSTLVQHRKRVERS